MAMAFCAWVGHEAGSPDVLPREAMMGKHGGLTGLAGIVAPLTDVPTS